MKLAATLTLAFVLALAAGCKKEPGTSTGDDGKVASCLLESQQTCREYRGGNLALGSDSLAQLCTTLVSTAKFAAIACPILKILGTCTKPEGKDFFYEGYAETPQAIEQSCQTAGGTFATK